MCYDEFGLGSFISNHNAGWLHTTHLSCFLFHMSFQGVSHEKEGET